MKPFTFIKTKDRSCVRYFASTLAFCFLFSIVAPSYAQNGAAHFNLRKKGQLFGNIKDSQVISEFSNAILETRGWRPYLQYSWGAVHRGDLPTLGVMLIRNNPLHALPISFVELLKHAVKVVRFEGRADPFIKDTNFSWITGSISSIHTLADTDKTYSFDTLYFFIQMYVEIFAEQHRISPKRYSHKQKLFVQRINELFLERLQGKYSDLETDHVEIILHDGIGMASTNDLGELESHLTAKLIIKKERNSRGRVDLSSQGEALFIADIDYVDTLIEEIEKGNLTEEDIVDRELEANRGILAGLDFDLAHPVSAKQDLLLELADKVARKKLENLKEKKGREIKSPTLETEDYLKRGNLISEYPLLTDDQLNDLRARFKSLFLPETYSSYPLTLNRNIENLVEGASNLISAYPEDENELIILGESSLWFMETTHLLTPGRDRFRNLPFTLKLLQRDTYEKKRLRAYKDYLKKVGLDPKSILEKKSKTVFIGFVKPYALYPFLEILKVMAVEEGVDLKTLRDKISLHILLPKGEAQQDVVKYAKLGRFQVKTILQEIGLFAFFDIIYFPPLDSAKTVCYLYGWTKVVGYHKKAEENLNLVRFRLIDYLIRSGVIHPNTGEVTGALPKKYFRLPAHKNRSLKDTLIQKIPKTAANVSHLFKRFILPAAATLFIAQRALAFDGSQPSLEWSPILQSLLFMAAISISVVKLGGKKAVAEVKKINKFFSFLPLFGLTTLFLTLGQPAFAMEGVAVPSHISAPTEQANQLISQMQNLLGTATPLPTESGKDPRDIILINDKDLLDDPKVFTQGIRDLIEKVGESSDTIELLITSEDQEETRMKIIGILKKEGDLYSKVSKVNFAPQTTVKNGKYSLREVLKSQPRLTQGDYTLWVLNKNNHWLENVREILKTMVLRSGLEMIHLDIRGIKATAVSQ